MEIWGYFGAMSAGAGGAGVGGAEAGRWGEMVDGVIGGALVRGVMEAQA